MLSSSLLNLIDITYFIDILKILQVPASQTSYSATDLKAGRYDFWVTASTIIGEGQPSATASCSPSDKGTSITLRICKIV